jgi:hypothetical protein
MTEARQVCILPGKIPAVEKDPTGRISYEGKHRCLVGPYGNVSYEVFQDSTGSTPTGKKIPRGGILREGKDLLEILWER